MCMINLLACMSMYYMHAVFTEARRGHQIPWNFQIAVSHLVGAGSETWDLLKSSQCLNH